MALITRDSSGNIRAIVNQKATDGNGFLGEALADCTTHYKVGTADANTATCTLAANSGKRWVLDHARVILASVASTALCTITDGTTTYAFKAGDAGGNDVDVRFCEGVVFKDGGSVQLQAGTAGASSTSNVILKGRLVTTAEI